jgi:hypothetical protein
VACCRWCGIGLGWSGALAGPPRDDPDWSRAMSEDYPAPPPELSPGRHILQLPAPTFDPEDSAPMSWRCVCRSWPLARQRTAGC